MKTYIIVSIILLITWRRDLDVQGQMEKPGTCIPWVGGAGPCVSGCTHDWSCTGLQKCCPVGCGRMCQNPCSNTCDTVRCGQGGECKVINNCAQCVPSSGKNEKLGTCLFTGTTKNGNKSCLNECENDFDCFGNMKCCAMGCKKMCQNVCSGICNLGCDSNSECKIVDGCAHCVATQQITSTTMTQIVSKVQPTPKAQIVTTTSTTTKPTTYVTVKGEKPGRCLKWQGNGPCLTNCNMDGDCPENRKCCTVGCGKICQDPCPTVCDWECFDGKKCEVVDGCAQCVGPSGPRQKDQEILLTSPINAPTTIQNEPIIVSTVMVDTTTIITTTNPQKISTSNTIIPAATTYKQNQATDSGDTQQSVKRKHKSKKKKQHPRQ